MAGGYSTGFLHSPRREQTWHPVRNRTVARSRAASNVGVVSVRDLTLGLREPIARRAAHRNDEHFLVDRTAVCAATRARINTFSAVGGGSICGNSVQRRIAPHFPLPSQDDSSVMRINAGANVSHYPRQFSMLAYGLPGRARPCAAYVYFRHNSRVRRNGSNRPPEVSGRNALQRLAGRSIVLFSSFRVTDSGGQKVRPDLHALTSSPAAFVAPVLVVNTP